MFTNLGPTKSTFADSTAIGWSGRNGTSRGVGRKHTIPLLYNVLLIMLTNAQQTAPIQGSKEEGGETRNDDLTFRN